MLLIKEEGLCEHQVILMSFFGRVPKSVLAKHYTDYNPERLKELLKANLRVLI